MVPECKPEWNREAITVFSRLPSLMAADKPCPLLQPSLVSNPLDTVENQIGKLKTNIFFVGVNKNLRTFLQTFE